MSRILLIDDEAASRLVMNNRLRDLQMDVVAVDNGAKGLLEARESRFDVILVDAGLSSGVNAAEVCRRLRQMPANANVAVIVFAKSSVSRDEVHKAYEAGCDVFLSKTETGSLEDVLSALKRSRAQQAELARQHQSLVEEVRRMRSEQVSQDDLDAPVSASGDNALVFRELAAGRPDGVLLVDAEGVVRLADRGARDLFGASLQGKNLGRLAPASGLEAFVRDARTEAREGFRFDLPSRSTRGSRSVSASVVPLIANPGEKDPGLRVVVLLDAGRRRVASELLRMQEYSIPRREVGVLLDAARVAFGPASLVGSGVTMARLRSEVAEQAEREDAVLVIGEPGSGKKHVARALHFGGHRPGPFVPVSCSALNEEHLEAEIFGQVKGAFADAIADRPGALHQADHGTVFLENIDSLTLPLQEKLLATIKKGTVSRAGTERAERVETRVVASTSIDLSQRVKEGTFLPELLDALRTVTLRVPPLRERREDVPGLAQHFARRHSKPDGECELSDEVLWALPGYDWPGNVRELESCIDRACTQARTAQVGIDDLPESLRELYGGLPQHDLQPAPRGGLNPRVPASAAWASSSTPARAMGRGEGEFAEWEIRPDEAVSLDLYEKKALLRALNETGGDKLAAARLLKVGKSTLYRKLKRFGIT